MFSYDETNKECFIDKGKWWEELPKKACARAGRYITLTQDDCVTFCEENNQEGKNGRCVCVSETAIKDGECVLRGEEGCMRTEEDEGTDERCLSSDTCPEGNVLATDGVRCLTGKPEEVCGSHTVAPSGEFQCTASCPEFHLPSGKCVARCMAGYYRAFGARACGRIP